MARGDGMYDLLVKLMVVAALAQFGMTVYDVQDCRSRACIEKIEKHSREVLNVDWKPMTVFPEESKRFSSASGLFSEVR
jgi:hypothetical protein